MKPRLEGTLLFILAAQEANNLVVPLLDDTVVLNALCTADVAVVVQKLSETPEATKELV